LFTPGRGSCKDCEEHYKFKHKTNPDKYPNDQPPCILSYECPFGKPTLTVRNGYIFDLYQKCAHQQIMAGMGQPIGIIFQSILALFDIYGIIDTYERREIFEKIQIIDHIRLKAAASDLVNKRTTKTNK